MEDNEARYERARWRLSWVVYQLSEGRFSQLVPRSLLEEGDPQRSAIADLTHALMNVPVEYARYKWGWSQRKTKLALGLVLGSVVSYIMYVLN